MNRNTLGIVIKSAHDFLFHIYRLEAKTMSVLATCSKVEDEPDYLHVKLQVVLLF